MSNSPQSSVRSALDEQCESVILSFERARLAGPVSATYINELLEEVSQAKHGVVLSEFACIDLERAFETSDEFACSPFIEAFPLVFANHQWRDEVGFEHYRLSRLNGLARSREEIGARYGVDGSLWRELPKGAGRNSGLDATIELSPAEYPCPGETFGGYPILAELGHGALAKVFLARQPDLAQRLVVLKVTKRLTSESDKLASLQHSNIVPVFSVHQVGSLNCICMPFLGVLTLADLLISQRSPGGRQQSFQQLISTVIAKRVSTIVLQDAEPTIKQSAIKSTSTEHDGERLNCLNQRVDPFCFLGCNELAETLSVSVYSKSDIETSVLLIARVTDGMAYAHSRGIVHRDLKPDNLLIANDGRPIILDFNLATHTVGNVTNMVGGTLPYMSPEQIRALHSGRNGAPTDDVFSLGVILYQLLVGKLPFDDADLPSLDDSESLAATREIPPISLRKLNPGVPPSLESIVQKCLSGTAIERYPSAIELHEDLTRFQANQVLRYAIDRSPVERMRKFVRRHPTATSATSITLISIVLISGVTFAWLWNAARVAILDSSALAHNLHDQLPGVLSKLQAPQRDADMLRSGIEEASLVLRPWKIGPQGVSENSVLFRLTPPENQQAFSDLGYLLYALAGAEANMGLFDDAERAAHLEVAIGWNGVAQGIDRNLKDALDYQGQHLSRLRGKSIQEPSRILGADTATSLLARLLLAREKSEFVKWQQLSEELVELNPTDPTSWFNLGSAHYSAGDFSKAELAFDVSTKLQPKSPMACFWRGLCRLQVGNVAGARADFTRCIQIRPDWEAARYNRALADLRAGRYSDGIEDLDHLIGIQLAGPRVWDLRSRLQQSLGNRELALADRQHAMVAPPVNADDWVVLGLFKMASSPQDAISALTQALVMDPWNVAALQNLAHLYSETLHEPAEGIEYMNRLVKTRPQDASFVASRGILAARCGNCRLATEDALQAATLRPTALERLQIAGIYALLVTRSKTESQADGGCFESVEVCTEKALSWLAKAMTLDPQLASIAESDPDLENLRNLERFKQLLASARTLSISN